MRSSLLAIVVGLTTLACDDDPARSVHIIDRSPAAAALGAPAGDAPGESARSPGPDAVASAKITARAPAPAPARPAAAPPPPRAAAGSIVQPRGELDQSSLAVWSPRACPPPPEDSPGPSRLTVTGPCAFRHDGAVNCSATDDDFVIAITRKAAGEATLVIYINVESYHGPGDYVGAQMFVAVQDGTSMYRWSNDNFAMTVGPGEAFVVFPATRLDGEPLLIDCSRQIGPSTNYQYQCEGTADSAAVEHSTEVVSGTLNCSGNGKELALPPTETSRP